MALCWVKAGECGEKRGIEARKTDPTHAVAEIITTCEHLKASAVALGEVDAEHSMYCHLAEAPV